MSWTDWTLLADKKCWYVDEWPYDGPSCYELGTAGPQGGDIQPHYVGETSNEKRRMAAYGRNGSHLAEVIDDHLRRGWFLWYRGRAFDTKKAAKAMQDRMLGRHVYDWNVLLNGTRWEF